MRRTVFMITGVLVVGTVFLMGCNQSAKTGSSSDAIQSSKAMATVQEKTSYLIQEAKAFYNSKKFQDAVAVSQYVLQYLDKNSQEAQSLLEKAKAELEAKVKGAMEDAKSKLGSFGSK